MLVFRTKMNIIVIYKQFVIKGLGSNGCFICTCSRRPTFILTTALMQVREWTCTLLCVAAI